METVCAIGLGCLYVAACLLNKLLFFSSSSPFVKPVTNNKVREAAAAAEDVDAENSPVSTTPDVDGDSISDADAGSESDAALEEAYRANMGENDANDAAAAIEGATAGSRSTVTARDELESLLTVGRFRGYSPSYDMPVMQPGEDVVLTSKDVLITTWAMDAAERFDADRTEAFTIDPTSLGRADSASAVRGVTLGECLSKFTAQEQLSRDNMW